MVRQMSSAVGGLPPWASRTGGEGDGAVASGRGAKLGSVLEACDVAGGDVDADVDAWDGGSAASAGREAKVDWGASVTEGSAAEGCGGEGSVALVCACAVALQQTRPQISNGPATLIMLTKHLVFVSDVFVSDSLLATGRRRAYLRGVTQQNSPSQQS
jgi:hypothetical protein